MLNLIGEGVAKGAKKALSKATKEAGEEVAEKAVKTVAKKAVNKTRTEVLSDMAKEMASKYGKDANKLMRMYSDGNRNAVLGKILNGTDVGDNLMMYHATTPEKMSELLTTTGYEMANPSLQITKPTVNAGGDFGDVILLGNKDIAYPNGRFGELDTLGKTNIYSRDVYSKRKPLIYQGEDGATFRNKNGQRELATAENISRDMNRYPVRGSEMSGQPSAGSIAAQTAEQYKSLADVVSDQGRILDKGQVRDAIRNYEDELYNVANAMVEKSNGTMDINGAFNLIDEIIGNKGMVLDGFNHLPVGYGLNNDGTFANQLQHLYDTISNLPTDYFELKANRPVKLSEFSGALLPENFGGDGKLFENNVLSMLEKNNIPILGRFTPDEDAIGLPEGSYTSKVDLLREMSKGDRLSTPYLMSVKPDFNPDYDTRMTIDKLSNSVKRVGSKDVAKVDKKTLPVGWKELEKRMDLNYMDDKIAKLAGKEKFRDVTLPDMKKILDDMGYGVDPELLKVDGEQIATYNALKDAIDDELAMEMSSKGGKAAPEFLKGRSGVARGRYAEPENFYLDHQGRAGYLDAELSDRLGIGLSNTPLSDDLNNYTSRDAAGDYFATGIGLKPSEILRGERELSTMAHERLHSFQNTAGDYAPEVGQAYNELHEALAPYKLNKKQIKDYHGKLGHGDPEYYLNDHEQEARMWQEYLDRAGYTNAEDNRSKVRRKFLAGRSEEFDPGIDNAFDQFLLKLRTLSKAGVALPAVGLALLLGENYNNKKKEG